MQNTAIEWADHSWNPWVGCRKVSAGCRECYMFTRRTRLKQDPRDIHRTTTPIWRQPRKFEPGSVVFVCSWSDFFLEDADPWRDDAWRVIESRPDLIWILLTKRPENIAGRLPWTDTPWPNVIGMVTTEDQEMADLRVPILMESQFAVRGLSIEPMLGPINITQAMYGKNPKGMNCFGFTDGFGYEAFLQCIICGGETGRDARAMHPAWPMSIRDQCQAAGVQFIFKQWGEWGSRARISTGQPVIRTFDSFQQWVNKAQTWVNGGICIDLDGKVCLNGKDMETARYPVAIMHRVGKKRSGRFLDGRIWDEMPRIKEASKCA